MKISDRLKSENPCFSFEFFPPKSDAGVAQMFDTLRELQPLDPGFVSVTYGAGGSTRQRTFELVTAIKKETGIEAMAHLTCVGHSRTELTALVDRFADAGIENLLALRGDVPSGGLPTIADALTYGSELTALIRERRPQMCIGGACYPEGHMESETRDVDLRNLRRKVAAGSDFLVTQLFFDNAFYFHFVERARALGVHVPVVPGIMPITNFEQIDRFTRMCGATIPTRLRLELERRKDDPEAILELGVAHATLQCAELLRMGAPGIHFYTLNRSRASRMIFAALKSAGF
ncbi:MAG: methylenetetrahydrofolate reductase [NAD(P)H] [Polyangia bacterium]